MLKSCQIGKKRPRKNNFKTQAAGDHLKDFKAADEAIEPVEDVQVASEPLEDVKAADEASKSLKDVKAASEPLEVTDEASEPLEDVKATAEDEKTSKLPTRLVNLRKMSKSSKDFFLNS